MENQRILTVKKIEGEYATLTDGSEELSRTIIIIKKTTHTPPKYPRNNSQIAKKRL